MAVSLRALFGDLSLIGYDVLWRAARNIAHGQIFDENFLMCIATLGAFALAVSRGVTGREIEGFDEACAVLLFYQVGEFFQSYATGKSRRSISALMDIRPDYANVRRGDGVETVDPAEVAVGEVIVVYPGEKIPLDGVVQRGTSTLDTKALTGESLPREVAEGDEIVSGCVNLTSQIEVTVQRVFTIPPFPRFWISWKTLPSTNRRRKILSRSLRGIIPPRWSPSRFCSPWCPGLSPETGRHGFTAR